MILIKAMHASKPICNRMALLVLNIKSSVCVKKKVRSNQEI